MATLSIVLFAAAALFGIGLAASVFRGKLPPVGLAVVHGLLAASGLVVLILTLMKATTAGTGGCALGLFVLAALGGFVLFGMHLKKKSIPGALVVVHALAAVAGFAVLVIWAL
jgi:hypothetical protein